jgi:glycosyltransferase involved in cell wall biosynthesis
MKICYMNPALLLRRPIAEIIERVSKEHEVGLLIPKPLGKPLDNSLHYSKLPKGVKLYTYSIIQPPGPYEWPIPITPMFFVQLFRVFWKYDIVHMWAQFYFSNIFAALFAVFFRTKLILTMDTIAGYSFSAGKAYDRAFRWYYRVFGWLIFGAPSSITLYGESLIPFAKKAGINLKKVRVISTGIDMSKQKRGDAEVVRKEFGLKDEKIILYGGLLVPRKGIETLLRTVAKIKGENIKVFLVGDGPNRKEYEDITKKLRIKDKVIFTGFRKDIFNFYAVANVFLFPSQGEGLPGVVMESEVFKLPVVTSNIPCIPDLVEDGKSGFLCEMEDVECFRARTLSLLNDPELHKRIREEAYEKIKGFEWSNVIGKYYGLYNEVLLRDSF